MSVISWPRDSSRNKYPLGPKSTVVFFDREVKPPKLEFFGS